MPPNKVYAIVEGHGEAQPPEKGKQPAAYILIRKLLQDRQCYTLFTPSRYMPWRMRSSGDFNVPGKLENVVRAHLKFEDCAAVLILRDLDDGCAAQTGPQIAQRIRALGPLPFSVLIVCAVREYEAWFLASLESIHPGHIYPNDPETIRDAKGWLARQFHYHEASQQADYTDRLDIATILENRRSRSFQHLHDSFDEIIQAHQVGQAIITPESY